MVMNSEVQLERAINSLTEALENHLNSEDSNQSATTEPIVAPETMYPLAPTEIENTEVSNSPIPENSGSLLVKAGTSRFSGAVWYNEVQKKTILLAGLGGIGSWTALLLARLSPNSLILYDDDIVEGANMSGQLFSRDYIGYRKTSAIVDIMHKFSDFSRIYGFDERYHNGDSEAADIMICGFDSMESRKGFYASWIDRVSSMPSGYRKHCLFIDGRLSAETLQVLCIRGDDDYNKDRYRREWLFSDEDAEPTQCSYKQTSFMANMIASIIVNLFVNFCANELEGEEAPIIERDLPFLTAYDASMMMFTTEA